MASLQDSPTRDSAESGHPSGDNGRETASVTACVCGALLDPENLGHCERGHVLCRCGSGPHPEHERRCASGHALLGNDLAVVVGQRSVAFWAAHQEARQELQRVIVEDAGHTLDDAPHALLVAADGLAQATLIRDSAFARVVQAGGPLTASGRTRRAFLVWTAALDRVERHLRLLGLKRESKPLSLSAAIEAREDRARDDISPAKGQP